MKKTLIALAVLAASGASFAQVTVTGKLGFSYQKNAVVTAPTHGMVMSDGDLNFTATEDLGGGMKITAKQAFASRGRDTGGVSGLTGRDASLQLVTGAGVFTMSAVESCSKIDNVAGAPVSLATGQDNGSAPLDGCANLDNVAYNVPIGPLVIGLNYSDSIGGAGVGSGAPFTATQITVAYSAGPLALGADHTTFAHAVSPLWDGLSRTRLTAAYDLGVAKIGFGHQVKNHDVASQTTLSVNVPMGAVDVGLTYATRAAQGTSVYVAELPVADSRTATAVGVKYALSKQTSLQASYGTYSNTATLGNEYRIRLMKSF